MNLKKDMLLGFSNLRDAKNDTMVGGRKFFKFW